MEELIKQQLQDHISKDWGLERLRKLRAFEMNDYQVKLYNSNLDTEVTIEFCVTEKGFVMNISKLRGILERAEIEKGNIFAEAI